MIDIADFSLGIISHYHNTNPVLAQANGAAQLDGTYGCCADGGSLVPLPRMLDVVRMLPQSSLPYTTISGEEGIFAIDSIYFLREVWILYVLRGNFGSGSSPYYFGKRYDISPAGVLTADADWWWSKANISMFSPTPYPGAVTANLAIGKSFTEAHADPPEPEEVYAHLVFNIPGTSPGSAGGAIPASEIAFITYTITNPSVYPTPSEGLFVLPAAATPTAISFDTVDTDEQCVFAFSHRNRVLGILRTDALVYGRAPYANPIVFSQAGTYWDGVTSILHLSDENDSQISWLANTSGEELLAMRRSGGGVLVRGDLEEPTIYRVPFVEPTYNSTTMPALTPLGLVYATLNGIFLWEGGDNSSKLSIQIDGPFWHTQSMIDFDYPRGRMNYWHPWVMVPNNFMFDTRTSSWWRLSNPDTHGQYNCYSVTDDGVLAAIGEHPWRQDTTVPAEYTSHLIETYLSDELAYDYSWTSHPLMETNDTELKFTDITLTYGPDARSTSGRITVSLFGYNDDNEPVESVDNIFTFDNASAHGGVVTQRQIVQPAFNGRHVQVRVQAESDDAPAPRLYRIQIATAPRQTLRRDAN